ncbi:hypothetical protein ACHM05_00360 [Staphylococcus aureus]|uniref:hypothetical protein n=2 Tax=Staphylococcus TaxID=1279 RepID=UPI0037742D9D
MTIFIMFLVILVLLIVIRALKKHYMTKKLKKDSQSNIAIVIRQSTSFLIKQIKTLIVIYILVVGMYVFCERVHTYNVFPANVEPFHELLTLIDSTNSNDFIFHIYVMAVGYYVVLILPYRILKKYEYIIEQIHSKDYLQSLIVKLWKCLERKIGKKPKER